MDKWNNTPHGQVSEKFREWYERECGYFYDEDRAKDNYFPWVVNGDDKAKDIDTKPTPSGLALRAYVFQTKYSRAVFALNKKSDEYPDNDKIFSYIQRKYGENTVEQDINDLS